MFPSQGYFFSINCQDFLQGKCSRAYCHFYHNEKLLRTSSSRASKLSKCENSVTKVQPISENVSSQQESTNSDVAHQSSKSDLSQQSSLNSVTTNEISAQNVDPGNTLSTVLKEAILQNVEPVDASISNETEPDLLTQLISEAVKKVLSENSALNASAIDPNSIIQSLNTTNIVSKAVQEVSCAQGERNINEKKIPKLYLPPPGTPCYQPTPIKELINKNKYIAKEYYETSTSQEYTPTPVNYSNNNESSDGQLTDFSSAEEDNECDARSDFDMLEEVLVEKLSSNPLRNKAIQKRKKALGRTATTLIPSKSLPSKKSVNSTVKSITTSSVETADNVDSSFLPPSPLFTSSTEVNDCTNYQLEQKSNDSRHKSNDSPVNFSKDSRSNSPLEDKVSHTTKTEIEIKVVQSTPVTSLHNLLPQIAELSRPNIKSWTPVAKLESLMSVEKMLEKLDRIDTSNSVSNDKHLKNISNNEVLTPSLDVQCPKLDDKNQKQSDIHIPQNIDSVAKLPVDDLAKLPVDDLAKLPVNDLQQSTTNSKESDTLIDKKKIGEKDASNLRKRSVESDNFSDKDRKRKKLVEEENDKDRKGKKLVEEENDSVNEKCDRERNSKSRRRSHDSGSSSDAKRKRKRSSSSSKKKKKKKKHKRKYDSTEDEDSSESNSCSSSEDDSKEKHLKRKRKKHKKHKSKDYKKRSKYERSKSRKRKSFSESSENSNSQNSNSEYTHTVNSKTDTVPNTPLAPHQIKQEKLDVDLSKVKIEKDACQLSDNSILNNKQLTSLPVTNFELQNQGNNSLSEISKTSLTDKLGDKSNNLNKLEKTKNLKNNANGSSSEKLSKTSTNKIDKCPSLNNVEKITSSSNKDKQSNKISSKSKLENYTSSLLSKVSHSLPNSENARLTSPSSKDSKHKPPRSLSITNEPSPKLKTLKEISMFDNLTELSNRKHSKSNHNSHSETKNKSKPIEKKALKTSLKATSHTEEGKEDRRSKSSHSEKQKECDRSSSSKHSSHSSHKKRHEVRHSSKNDADSSKVSKVSKDNKDGRKCHESSKLKSPKSKEATAKRSSDSDRKPSKDSRSEKSLSNKTKSTEKNLKEKNSKSDKSVKDSTSGCDSPIPDLSALDELPKEDWDQLLFTPSNQVNNSDSDEGVDIDQSFEVDDIDSSGDDDDDDINDPRVLEECKKVFSEYDPEKNLQKAVVKKDPPKNQSDENDESKIVVPTRKNRVAYSGAAGNFLAKPKALVKPRRKTPSEIMLERYEKLREEEAALKKKLEMQRQELAKHGQLPPNLAISSSSVSSSSDSTKTLSHSAVSSSTPAKKRISIAPGRVNALIKSKEMLRSSLSNVLKPAQPKPKPEPTLAMTNSKGTKRVAHIPKLETMERPIISTEHGTKVPQNIRQRYLNCFIDETLKFSDGELHAYNVALAEESICHKRATTRMVYLNLAVNTLKKLRAAQISEAAQKLLDTDPKYEDTKEKKFSSPPVVSSSSSVKKEHPVNPNHRTVSHFSVMASGGQKGSWSIQKSKKSLPNNIKDYLTGVKFYNCLKKYILSVETLEENCFPRPDPSVKGKAILKKINSRKKISPGENQRYCDRCSVLYEVDIWGLPVLGTSCVYHWGRAYKCRGIGGLESKYSCCQGDSQSEGCCLGTTHVSENFSPDNLTGYVRTIPKSPKKDGNYGVYALDCEMCYTTAGSELTRITVVNTNCESVFETLVKPENPIIDYNTRFSGITESDMEGVTMKLRDVQAALLTRFSDKTILMGHSLESDFSALKIIHDTVVDTSVVYPHKLGAPFKRALRNLASEYLSKIIQNDEGGHDSAEDANTCMQLMQLKVKEDLKGQL